LSGCSHSAVIGDETTQCGIEKSCRGQVDRIQGTERCWLKHSCSIEHFVADPNKIDSTQHIGCSAMKSLTET
jgi:hypothetical protein